MTPNYRPHRQEGELVASTERLLAALFDAVCEIRGDARPVLIRARMDQAVAATRDYLRAMTAVETENRPQRKRKSD